MKLHLFSGHVHLVTSTVGETVFDKTTKIITSRSPMCCCRVVPGSVAELEGQLRPPSRGENRAGDIQKTKERKKKRPKARA